MTQETLYKPGYPRGEFQDTLIGPQGEVIWERPWQHNTILLGMSKLIAALIKGDKTNGKPLGYWAVGTGEHQESQDALAKIEDLAKRILKKPIEPWQMIYLDTSLPDQVTKKIEITIDFSIDEFKGWSEPINLTEFGLFSESGFLINYHSHPAIGIKQGLTLKRKLHLMF